MKQYKVGFLINPISGGGQGKVIAQFLGEIMQSFAFTDDEWIFEFTHKTGMDDQIDRMIALCSKIIAVGGDGTMSMVMKSLLKKRDTQVHAGLIPLGTGNDLARVLGIYQNFINKGLLNTIRKLISAESQKFDLWSINNAVTFAAYFSFGIDAKTIHNFDAIRSRGKVWGNSALINKIYYLFLGLRNRSYVIPSPTIIAFADEAGREHRLNVSGNSSVILSNIRSYSGGARPFSGSSFSDGYLEIMPVKNVMHFMAVLASGRVPFIKKMVTRKILNCYHAQKVTIEQAPCNYAQIDGEVIHRHLRRQRSISITHAGSVNLLSLESL